MIKTDTGFLAVGTASDFEAACVDDASQGRVWSSLDGLAWTAQPDEAFAQTELTMLFAGPDGALYVLGVTGAVDNPLPCLSGGRSAGTNIWRSTDAGSGWTLLPQSPALSQAVVYSVALAADTIVLGGWQTGTDDFDHAAAWSSTDGQTWTAAVLPPNAPHLILLAARDNVVVGFADDAEYPLAWISRDAGQNWYEESIDLDVEVDTDFSIAVEDVLATATGYAAVGDGCCLGAAELVPLSFTSADGTQWQASLVGGERTEAMRRMAPIPDGLLAVGVETFFSDGGDTSALGGRSWLSADGSVWLRGPDFAELGDGDVTALAVGAEGAVVAGSSFTDAVEGSTDTGLRIWYAPLSAFPISPSH